MNELQKIEERVKHELTLKNYAGEDRVVLAQEKWLEIQEEQGNKLLFSVNMGIYSLDECLKGLGLGRLVVLSGPPKNGKTQLCQTFTKRFDKQGHKQLWFSYEVGYEELFGKFMMENLTFYVPNRMESGNLDWIEDKIIEAKQKYGVKIVFIDHLDFLRDKKSLGSSNIGMNMSSYIGGIVQKIKLIAVQQEMLIFLMTHITKNNWTSNKLPTAEDIRDSGQVAQLADVVMMIARKRNKDSNIQEIYSGTDAIVGVIENRLSGKTKIVDVNFKDGEFFEIEKYQPLPDTYDDKLQPKRDVVSSDEEWSEQVNSLL